MSSAHSRSLLHGWLARLPKEKEAIYDPAVRVLIGAYNLFGLSLNEALALRDVGELHSACMAAGLSRQLARRHAAMLLGTMRALESCSRHHGTLPRVTPLQHEHFLIETAQRKILWTGFLHNVLFSCRARWFLKLRTLLEILTDLEALYCGYSLELAEGDALDPMLAWEALPPLYHDWNTCLQETVVLLKCFLTTLEASDVKAFQAAMLEHKGMEAAEETVQAPEKETRLTVQSHPEAHYSL